MKLQFSTRTMLLATAFVALSAYGLLGWWKVVSFLDSPWRMLVEWREKELRHAVNDYEQVLIAADDAAERGALREILGASADELKAPAFCVLDEENKIVAAKSQIVTAEEALEFLNRYALPKLDAEKLLAASLDKARREDKRVFLQETATWCGPCRMLSRYIAAHKDVFDQHFVYLKIDRERFEHGDEVMRRVRPRKGGGIPWVAILDGDAMPLGTSETPNGENYGFPSEPEAINHFVGLLHG